MCRGDWGIGWVTGVFIWRLDNSFLSKYASTNIYFCHPTNDPKKKSVYISSLFLRVVFYLSLILLNFFHFLFYHQSHLGNHNNNILKTIITNSILQNLWILPLLLPALSDPPILRQDRAQSMYNLFFFFLCCVSLPNCNQLGMGACYWFVLAFFSFFEIDSVSMSQPTTPRPTGSPSLQPLHSMTQPSSPTNELHHHRHQHDTSSPSLSHPSYLMNSGGNIRRKRRESDYTSDTPTFGITHYNGNIYATDKSSV
jgi:hypothetical protein